MLFELVCDELIDNLTKMYFYGWIKRFQLFIQQTEKNTKGEKRKEISASQDKPSPS